MSLLGRVRVDRYRVMLANGESVAGVVNVAVSDEDVGDVGKGNREIVGLGNGRYSRHQPLIRQRHSRPRIHQNQPVAVINQVNIAHQAGKRLHLKAIDVAAGVGGEFL